MEWNDYTSEEQGYLNGLFPGGFQKFYDLTRDSFAISDIFAGKIREIVREEICLAFGVDEPGKVAVRFQAIEETVTKPSPAPAINMEAIIRQVGDALLADTGFVIKLNKTAKEGEQADIESKKATIAEIVGEIRGIPAGNISEELRDRIFGSKILSRVRKDNWHSKIHQWLDEEQEKMASAIQEMLLARQRTKIDLSAISQVLVDLGVPTDDRTAIRAALLKEDTDKAVIPYLTKS